MKELNLLEILWLDAMKRLKIVPNDPNINERRKMFVAGVSGLVQYMVEHKPDKEFKEQMQWLMSSLEEYWSSENSVYRMNKNKDN